MTTLTDLRLTLLDRGFTPTPVMGKRPLMPGWHKKTQPTREEVEAWEQTMPQCQSTGVVCGKVGFLDADVTRADGVDALEELLRRKFSGRGKVLVRSGMPPKIAVPFRIVTPFRRITKLLDPPDGGKREELDFRGADCMVVVEGIHPDTGQPYSWRDRPLWDIRSEELPEVTEEEARRLVDEAAKVLVNEYDYKLALSYDENRAGAPLGDDDRPPEDLAKIREVLSLIPPEDYLVWLEVGCALTTISSYSPDGDWEELFRWWSARCPAKYDARKTREKWADLQKRKYPFTVRTLFFYAMRFNPDWRPPQSTGVAVVLNDFVAHMEMHNYVYLPTMAPWPAASVNARIRPMPLVDAGGNQLLTPRGKPKTEGASAWLDRHRPIEQMTWAPGEPQVIRHKLIADGGWFPRQGASVLNTYRSPKVKAGNENLAWPWVDLIEKVFPGSVDHVVTYFAHRVQRPGEKINHALVLGGSQGIGKDTILEALKLAVGHWNFKEISPPDVFSRNNDYVRAVVLRVNEARDTGDHDRFQFYERMKQYEASPPDVLRVNEKYLREYYVMNCLGVIITTNSKNSLYLPAEDRRHYVAWSSCKIDDFTPDFWGGFWEWYYGGGFGHVAAYLATRDLYRFNPKSPAPQTSTFWEIVELSTNPEGSELEEIIALLGRPPAVTVHEIAQKAQDTGRSQMFEWLTDPRSTRAVPHRMEDCGYTFALNPHAPKGGRWVICKRQTKIYARSDMSYADRLTAVNELIKSARADLDRSRRAGERSSVWGDTWYRDSV